MAGRLIDEDPEEAHKHALSAGRRAGRISVVRETIAITAYQVGDYALTLRELRTYRRISGRDDQLPLMVDSERGLGRPERALELGRSVDVSTLDVQVRVSLAIAMSGARLDLGQPQAALGELEIPQLDRTKAFSYSPALFAAYGTVLEDLGRPDEGERWLELADRAEDALAALDNGGADGETVEIIEEDIDVDDERAVGFDETATPDAPSNEPGEAAQDDGDVPASDPEDGDTRPGHDEESGPHDETAHSETDPQGTDDIDDRRA
nr:hypothetical protein [Frigoribacterium sp. VKM Ac-2836]